MKGKRAQSQKKLKLGNPLNVGNEFFGQTTSKEHFKDDTNKWFPEIVKNKNFGIVQLESPRQSYETVYKLEYKKVNGKEA